ncbi:MAG TPA: tyrosine-type recombinase/integrase [Lacunisphaera sp.]|jgi:integrase
MKTLQDLKSGQEVAKQSGQAAQSRYHVDYWKERLYRKTFTREGVSREVPEWSVRLQHLGRREAFALGSANASVSAMKAKEIATFLEANGWESALARFKPSPIVKAEICTVGEFLADVQTRSHLRARTVKIYATKLRKIVADIAKVDAGVKAKAKRAKHDYVNGGSKAWLLKVDGQSLAVLTPELVNAWRNAYAAKAGADPVKRKSAERTAASCIRCARALFSPDIVNLLTVKLPPSPFAGVKLKDPGPQRYHSEVNPEWLLTAAERELRTDQPQLYLSLVLCLWAGLRRKEADLLAWSQIDFEEGQIHIRRTSYFEPKTEESQRDIDLAPGAVEALRLFKADSSSEFVLDGGAPDPSATWPYYRANCTWRKLIAWLKGKGVSQRNAVHTLRKESGSLIASSHGIEAARQHLGHRDIRITSNTYVSKKRRVEVSVPVGDVGQLRTMEC